jgi:AraC-like DNA-binding protein
MSERSLRRGLSAEGTGYREVLDGLRHQRAVELLSSSRCSIAEVAYLLGFSEASAFHRAFRRWTGRTPAEVRASGRR